MRLLVVEDDRALGQILVRGLLEDGHAVDLERTVAGADHALSSTEYDLVVLDLGLPDGDGVGLCRRVRARGNHVPVLMLTARDGLTDKVSGLDAGADDYLTKPFDYPELAARVRALLRRPPAAAGPVLSLGVLTLDPARHRVECGDVVLPLTAREFSLLDYLLRRAGEVVSRTDLLEHVWDANYDGLSNVVDVHVANLRRKLAIEHSSPAVVERIPVIETVRGVGYRLGIDTGEVRPTRPQH
ncbi:MAG: response regulator transcription factor [Acidimicrobiales bacterium]|nr:response regulator transcription factor [Acidimicrobiales bacterium]